MEIYESTKEEFILSAVKDVLCTYLDSIEDDFKLEMSVDKKSIHWEIKTNGKEFCGGSVRGEKYVEQTVGKMKPLKEQRVLIVVNDETVKDEALKIAISKIAQMKKFVEHPIIEIWTPKDFTIPVAKFNGIEYVDRPIFVECFIPSYEAYAEGFDGLDIKHQVSARSFWCFNESVDEVVKIIMGFVKEVGDE